MQKAIVTGGGGFVGKAIVRQLIERGVDTAVIGRHRYPDVEKIGAQIFVGDIRDSDFLDSCFKGFDTVFHVAAKAGIWGDEKEYISINVNGTENVISACRKSNISRLIYTSTPSVVFNNESLENIDEKAPYADSFLCHYAASKVIAEKCVLAANNSDLLTTAIRPHLVWGPGDNHLLPRIIERGLKGQLSIVGRGQNKVDIAYIDNVADAHLLAAENLESSRSAAGQAYFISQGHPVNLWNWINDLFSRLSIPPVRKCVSFKKAYLAGRFLECVYTFFRIKQEPRMTRFLAEQLAKSHWFSIQKANDELGYTPRVTTEEGMNRTVSWLLEGNKF